MTLQPPTSNRTTKLKDAEEHLSSLVVQALRERDTLPENDPAINDASRAVIDAMREVHGEAWLGNVNLYTPEDRNRITWKHDGSLVRNFAATFVLPRYDAELERLIRQRDATPYTGTAEDGPRVDAISRRIRAVGGVTLYWT